MTRVAQGRFGVAALILGNEVLSGKIVDQNGPLLVTRLKAQGVALRGIAVLPDDVETIVEGLEWALRRAEKVITSGGIGPTHDDVTVQAVARALGRQVVRLPEMVELLERRGVSMTPEVLRLAEAPAGAQLIDTPGSWLPTLACEGVYLLPGVPPLFRLQLEAVLPRLPRRAVFLRTLFLKVEETEIAQDLESVAKAAPDVAIGSYPQWDRQLDHSLQITVEGPSREGVDAAADRVVAFLKSGQLVRSS